MNDKRFTRNDYAIYEKGNPICMTLRDVDIRLNELYEENEHIKNTIQDMIQTERTELGKSILKQLWSRIQ